MSPWKQDAIDPQWYFSEGTGSVRKNGSDWWFYPAWLPDSAEHDVGPFKTKKAAIAAAEKMHLSSQSEERT